MAKRQPTARKATKKRKAPAKQPPKAANAGARQETARLKRELAEALERQKATGEILAAISGSRFDLQAVLDTLTQSAARLCNADMATITRQGKDGHFYHATNHNFPDDWVEYTSKFPLKPGLGSVVGRTLLEKRAVLVRDVLNDPEYTLFEQQKKAGYRTFLGVPLLREGQSVGVFSLCRRRVAPFSKSQIELLSSFADQAVIAIENARLFDEVTARTDDLRELLQQQTATADVLKVISRSAFDLNSVLSTLVASAARLCGAERGLIFLRENDFFHTAANFGFSPELEAFARANPLPADGKSTTARAGVSGSPVQAVDLLADETQGYLAREYQRLGGHRTNLGVPLRRDGKTIGVFTLTRQVVQAFTPRQIELVQTFADQAVIAIENARLFDEVQARTEDLSEALRQQTATGEVLKVIASSPTDVNPALQAIVESACTFCNAYDAGVLLRVGEELHFSAHHGPIRSGGQPRPISRDWVVGRSVVDKVPVQVSDFEAPEAAEFSEGQGQSREQGHRCTLSVPLLREGEAIGAIALRRLEPVPFSEKQVSLLKTFADQAVIAIANVRLFEEVQERTRELTESLQQQTATAEVLQVINSSPGHLEPVFAAMLEKATHLCEAAFGILWLCDGEQFRAAALHGAPPAYAEITRTPIRPLPTNPLGRMLRGERLIVSADVADEEPYRAGDPVRRALVDLAGARSVIQVALVTDEKFLGSLTVYRSEVRPFSEKEIALLQNFAAQAVIAMENVRLFDELRQSLQQQTATADVLKVISRSAFDLQTVLDTLTESAAHLCGADMGAIARKDDRGFYHATNYNFAADWVKLTDIYRLQPGRESVIGRALLASAAVQIPDVLADPDYTYFDMQKVAGYRTLLGVPLLRGKEPIGVLFLGRKAVEPFTDKQIELVQTFADQAVIAIENVRLFDEVQAKTRELEESLQQQTATADVLKAISRSAFDLPTVLQTLVESAARLCDADKATITRQKGGEFYRGEFVGFSQDFIDFVRDVPVTPDPGSAIGRTLLEGAIIHIPDVTTDPDYTFAEAQRLGEFRTMLGVPMQRDDKTIGVFALTRSAVRPFTDKQIELATTFADQAAIAIENARLFEEVQQRTQALTRSLEDLRTAQDRLVQTEKLASLGQLTAGIAHEIKNPLNFVNNFSALSVELTDELRDVLKQETLTDKGRSELDELTGLLHDNLGKVVQHGKRADSIVKNMLLHSRESSGERRSADVNALVGESLNLAYHGARAEKPGFAITLKHDLDPDAGALELYPQEITRALLNLISNGFYAATKRKGENSDGDFEPVLSAATRNLGETVEIRIRDNGTGIPPDVREKMFNPFFTTKPTGEGTGLGLSMTHDIVVKQHGGRIDVETEPGAFTEFIITLPRGNGTAARLKPE